ncbi:MAG: ribonuclease E/G, partial [Alphaproteobacteria bacterium]
IKRRQILLVQVVKEERGNKGAALTTYLSLAGRFCVLMPNTARGGGISRKIVSPEARKRLKAIAAELPVPEGIGVILRTAGMGRSKAEIKRDFNYLLKLWDNIRELTLKSVAPALIHEEANLISRAIRDLYSRDIEEVLVEGEDGYRMAKDFMRKLMPSHAKRVTQYSDRIPLFHRYQVEGQLDAVHSAVVQLKSGGYIVINPTEALVAIDVNSGRATRERNIEETAFKTNLEAAEEIARELRLRDLSGLIVVDFIDMDEAKNNRTVERRFKEAMKNDRARIQVGHISPFGLLEMSRQRLRPSIIEASSQVCPHCGGGGHIRSIESTALHVLRAIEEEGIRERSSEITVYVPTPVALYILNQKRAILRGIEKRYSFSVFVASDDDLIPPDYRLDRVRARPGAETAAEAEDDGAEAAAGEDKPAERKQRRRRGKRPRDEDVETPAEAAADTEETAETAVVAEEGEAGGEAPRKRRRRGKRGGRRRRAAGKAEGTADIVEQPETVDETPAEDAAEPVVTAAVQADERDAAEETGVEGTEAAEPKTRKRGRRKKTEPDGGTGETAKPRARKAHKSEPKALEAASEPPPTPDSGPEVPEKPKRTRRKKIDVGSGPAPEMPVAAPIEIAAAPPERETAPVDVVAAGAETPLETRSKPASRRGWWQKIRGASEG